MSMMNIKNIKNEKILFFGYTLYLLANIFIESKISNISQMNLILRLIKYLGILFCLLSCFNSLKINKKYFIAFVVLFFFSVVNMIFSKGGSGLIEILIIVICFSIMKTDINKVFKQCITVLTLGYIIVIILSFLGIIQDEVTSRWFGNYMGSFFAGEYIRHQMGFLSSNQIPLTLMIIYIMLIAYKKDSISFFEHLCFLFANLYCFFNFGSRVSFILILFIFILFYLVKIKQKNKTIGTSMCFFWLIFIICGFISISCSYLYNPNSYIWFIINQIFYNRLRWSQAVLKNYGVSFFGFGLEIGKTTGIAGENIIDNGYILLLMQKGVILFIIIIGIWCYITYKAEKEKNYFLLISLLIIAIASLIDDHLISYKMIPFYCLCSVYNLKYKSSNIKNADTKRKK